MNIENFIKLFILTLDIEPDVELDSETELYDLDEWSSMAAVQIIAMVIEHYNVTLEATDIRKAQTIGDIYNRNQDLQK